jgi:hypothetical protein
MEFRHFRIRIKTKIPGGYEGLMLDIKFVRENPDLVKENIKKKFQDEKLPLVDEVIKYDAEARKVQQEAI